MVISSEQEDHIWIKHQVSTTEVYQVCFSDALFRRGRDGSLAVYGRTDAGRFVVVFLYPRGGGIYALATARDMNDAERRRLRRSEGRR